MLYKYDKNQLVFRSVKLKTYLKTITIIVLAIGISSFASYKLGVDRAITGLTEFEKVTIIKKQDSFNQDKLVLMMKELNVKFPWIPMAQSMVETGHWKDNSKEEKAIDPQGGELDAELLRRLMVKLGVADKRAKEIIAAPVSQKRAEIKKEADGSTSLEIQDPFDRAWRRVGLALDIIGFVIEDKDRSNGIYFVKYADVDIDDSPKKKKGVIDSLMFWSDDDKKDKQTKDTSQTKEKPLSERLKFWGGSEKEKTNPEKQYRIKILSIDNGGSQVIIEYQDGKKNNSSTANRIISLLYDQLK